MSFDLQEGIYYLKKPQIGNSYCMISLKAHNPSKISEIGNTIATIWNCILKLKKGIIPDLNIDPRHRKDGNLTALLAYGPKVFELSGSKRRRPLDFSDDWNFKPPRQSDGGQIIDGSEMNYSPKLIENHLLHDHIIIQLIADNEFYTKRGVVEIWKQLRSEEKNSGVSILRITKLYTGFQRQDYRNWLGFHDGLSNLKSQERSKVIRIDPRNLNSSDKWMAGGTYLGFIRIDIDIEKWDDIDISEQEKIIGREKITGCPLVKIDKNGRPVKNSRCPVPGTSEIIDRGNENFRDHPPYGMRPDDKILQFSHIGSTRPIDRIPLSDKRSSRIYRQGFEYLGYSEEDRCLTPGLNFVSFQNSPEKLFRSLTYRPSIPSSFATSSNVQSLGQYMKVIAAGIFLVPPITQQEPFPGAGIFFNSEQLAKLRLLNFKRV